MCLEPILAVQRSIRGISANNHRSIFFSKLQIEHIFSLLFRVPNRKKNQHNSLLFAQLIASVFDRSTTSHLLICPSILTESCFPILR